jgi:hypothetical protein
LIEEMARQTAARSTRSWDVAGDPDALFCNREATEQRALRAERVAERERWHPARPKSGS